MSKKTITFNLETWHFVIFIIITNIICVSIINVTNETENGEKVQFPHPVLSVQLIINAIFIITQIFHSCNSFKKCRNCGHAKHQHNKKDLIKKGFTFTRSVCDNYEKVKNGEHVKENWEYKYKDGHSE
jgi:hypothetical protein